MPTLDSNSILLYVDPFATGDHIHGIPTEFLIQSLSKIYKDDHPDATTYMCIVNIPTLLENLTNSILKGDLSVRNNSHCTLFLSSI